MKKYCKCAVCGDKFESHNPNPKFCSIECRGKSQQASIDLGAAVSLYESGLTQLEVARHFGYTQRAISNLFKRNGIVSRVACKRSQQGSDNHMWKGDQAGYAANHNRVERARGNPKHCEICGESDPLIRYEWANLTGEYHNIQDYKRMCRSCHAKNDGTINNIRHMREKNHA